jgi:predicted MFS family arabinose efflux permease
VGLGPHLVGAAGILGVVVLVAVGYLLPSEPSAGGGEPAFARPNRTLAWLGIMAFCVLVGEGAMADWSAVYLSGTLETGPGMAAAGFAAFSLMMAVGRLTGDRLNVLLGPVLLVRIGGVLAALGLGVALFAGAPAPALVGFAAVGAGFSIVFPIVLSTAAKAPGMAPGAAIAAMATTGYFGFLLGPPLIGFVAELVTLRGALFLIVLSSLGVALLAGSADPKRYR